MSAHENKSPESIPPDRRVEPERGVLSRRARAIRIEIAPWTIISIVLVIASLWIILRLLPVILVLVGALMIVGALGPVIEWLERRGMRRGAAIAVVFSVLFVSVVLIFALTLPELVTQVKGLFATEPALRERLAVWFERFPVTQGLADAMRNVQYDAIIKSSATSVLTFFTIVVE